MLEGDRCCGGVVSGRSCCYLCCCLCWWVVVISTLSPSITQATFCWKPRVQSADIKYFVHSSIHSSIHPFFYPSNLPSIHSFIHPFFHPSISSSIHFLIHPFLHPPILPCIHFFIHLKTSSLFHPSCVHSAVKQPTRLKNIHFPHAQIRRVNLFKLVLSWVLAVGNRYSFQIVNDLKGGRGIACFTVTQVLR